MKKTAVALLGTQVMLMAGIADMKKLYIDKRYAEVVSEARKSTSLYSDPRLHMLWGKSAEALGDDEAAMSAYERVLMLDPDNVAVRVHLASLYSYLDRDELAQEMVQSTQNYQLTPSQRNSLDILKKADEEDLKIAAKFAIGYDSNINVSPVDIDVISGDDAISTMFAQFIGNVSHTYTLSDDNAWYLRTDGNIFYQNNFDSKASDYDLFAFSANMGVGYRGENYDILFPVQYGRLHYLDRDYMQSVGVNPRINFFLSETLIGNFNARYTQRSYLEASDKNRDDSVRGYGGGVYWLFDKNFAYLTSNYDDYVAKYGESLLFTEKETFNLSAGINYHVQDWFITRFDYRYRYTLYGDFLPNGTKQRSDYYNQAEVKLSRMFLETMEGSLLYRYAQNRSNYDLAEYDKDIVIFGLQYNY
jgi:tetratricopeptide (TPR) repeat protein